MLCCGTALHFFIVLAAKRQTSRIYIRTFQSLIQRVCQVLLYRTETDSMNRKRIIENERSHPIAANNFDFFGQNEISLWISIAEYIFLIALYMLFS